MDTNQPQHEGDAVAPPSNEQASVESALPTGEQAGILSLFKQAFTLVKSFLHDRFSIIDLAEPEATITGIKKDADFRGFSLWILIFSIFIASIGLNVNSTAVVIGAMLISPLMGPIMGIGLSLGTYDFALLGRSLKNLGVAVFISLITSSLYFLLSPISAPSNELFARTNPTLLDVLVAFFGGLAGILAGSRREKSNVIPGVAIATALMPPLCTAGYGLAHLEWQYFFGALYLFLINSVLIATSTTITVRYLRFPQVSFLDAMREKKAKRWFSIALVVVIVPSIWIFYRTVSNTLNETKVQEFITATVDYPGAEIVKEEIAYDGGVPSVSLVLFGEPVPENLIGKWANTFAEEFKGELIIVQGKEKGEQSLQEMSRLIQMYSEGRAEIQNYQSRISELESELGQLEAQLIPSQLSKEVQINYPEIIRMSLGTLQGGITEDSNGALIPVALVDWDPNLSGEALELKRAQLRQWLKIRLDKDTVFIR